MLAKVENYIFKSKYCPRNWTRASLLGIRLTEILVFEINGVLCPGLYGRPKALQLEEEKAPKFNWGLFADCLQIVWGS